MKTSPFLLALGTIGVTTVLSLALNNAQAAKSQPPSTFSEELIQQLIAMNGPDRRAYFKAMPVGERGELWMAMKRYKSGTSGIKGTGSYAQANPSANGNKSAPGQSKHGGQAPRGGITIQYDQGAFSQSFGTAVGIIGNRFDTRTGIPVLASGTVDTIEAVVVPGPANTTSSAGFVMLGPQTGGGGAGALFSSFTAATGATDTISFPGIGVSYTGASFFVLFGDFANSYVPVFGTETVNGQGHHGVVGYTGGMGPNITSTFDFGGTLNAFVRASGTSLPVELTDWNVE